MDPEFDPVWNLLVGADFNSHLWVADIDLITGNESQIRAKEY